MQIVHVTCIDVMPLAYVAIGIRMSYFIVLVYIGFMPQYDVH